MITHRLLHALAAAFLSSALLATCSSDPVVDPSPGTGTGPPPGSAGLPSTTPGVGPTPGPTPGLTPGPSPTGPPPPSASPSAGLPIDRGLFNDDFGDAASPLWGTGTHPSGLVAYADGALRIDLSADLNSLWSWRAFQPEQTVDLIRAEGTVATSGAGAAGWMCGMGDDRYVGGLIHSSGDWVVVGIIDAQSSALGRGPLPAAVDPASPHRLTVECAGTDAGSMRVRLLVDGQEATSLALPDDISDFDRVGAYAFADQAGYAAAFDDAAVFGGDAGDAAPGSPIPSP